MKITCQREKFLTAFQIVAAVVPSRSTKSVLQNVKLEIGDKDATLMATDLEIGIRYEISDVHIEQPGSIILPVDRFGSILRESMDETIHIDANERLITIQGEHSEFKLQSTNPDEFPPIAVFDEPHYVEVSSRLFRELIHRTIFATENENSRYALGGILLSIENDRIIAVATDGRRLAKMEGPVVVMGDYKPTDELTIVPSRSMQLLERTISDDDNQIHFASRANDILVKSQRATICARLLEGRFPRWRDVFPKYTSPINIDMLVRPLHASVRQAAIVTSEESRGVNFTFGSGALILAGQSADIGQSRVDMPIPYNGNEITIKLDPRYMSDFLKVLDPDKTFSMALKDSENAVLCTTDDGYAYVIMPLAQDH